MGTRCGVANPQSAAVPATVSGERSANMPLRPKPGAGKAAERNRAVSQETCRRTSLVRRPGPAAEPDLSAAATRAALRVFARPACRCLSAPLGGEARRRTGKSQCAMYCKSLCWRRAHALPSHRLRAETPTSESSSPRRARRRAVDDSARRRERHRRRRSAQRAATTRWREALVTAPGLGVVQAGGAGQQTSLFAGGANSNHTLVLFDGLRINDPSTPGSSFDAGEDQIGELDAHRSCARADERGVRFGRYWRRCQHDPAPWRTRRRSTRGSSMGGGSFGTLTGAAGVDGTLGAFRYAITGEGFATDGYDLVPKRMSTHTGERDGAHMTTLTRSCSTTPPADAFSARSAAAAAPRAGGLRSVPVRFHRPSTASR